MGEAPVTRAEFDLLAQMVECLSVQPFMPFSDTSGPRTAPTEDLMRRWVEYRRNPASLQAPAVSSPPEADRG